MKILIPQAISIASSNVTASSYPSWNATSNYVAGTHVYLAHNYGEYKCRVDNTNTDPSTSVYNSDINPEGKWEFLGTANRFKMFDQFQSTQTINATPIEVSVLAYSATGLFLGNLDAISVNIKVIDNITGVVLEEKTYAMYRDVVDWLDYFYGDWIEDKKTYIVYERTTLNRDISFLIKIDNGQNSAKCGIYMSGIVKLFGLTKWKIAMGIEDYSSVGIDTSTGATYLKKGNRAKIMKFDIFTPTGTVEIIYDMLGKIIGTPIVMIQSNFGLYNVYGYIQSSETVIEGVEETAITGQIMGLI